MTLTFKPSFSARILTALAATAVGAGTFLQAQKPAGKSKTAPDVLVFTNGEKLIGQLESAKGDSITFKSEMAGEVTVKWSNIQELHTSQAFAIIGKNVKLRKHMSVAQIPQGQLAMTDQKIQVRAVGAAPRTVPVADSAFVVGQSDFEKAVNEREGFFKDWAGTVTGGISLVEATQRARTFTGAADLVRAEPTESWMNPGSRTLVNFSSSYGTLSQPGTPDVKTNVIHAGAERDQYFSPRLFGFGQAAFDHNFSQGLSLQQTYGGGIGWTVIKRDADELDLKGAIDYVRQSFQIASANQNLAGSTFAEIYTRKFAHGIVFNEQLSVAPAWTNTRAYSATGTAGLAVPVFKRFSLAVTSLDTFLNDPPPGFRKNSFQFTTGLTYTLK
jgi:Protein of unknown function, DUF481